MSVDVQVTFSNGQVFPYQTPNDATVATLRTLISTNQTPLRGAGAAIVISRAAAGAALLDTDKLRNGMYFAR